MFFLDRAPLHILMPGPYITAPISIKTGSTEIAAGAALLPTTYLVQPRSAAAVPAGIDEQWHFSGEEGAGFPHVLPNFDVSAEPGSGDYVIELGDAEKEDLAGNREIFDWLYRKKASLKSRATFRGVAGPVADLGANLPKWKVVGAVQMLCVDGKGRRIGSGHCVVGKVTKEKSVVRRPLLQVWVGEMGVGDGMKIYCEPVKFAGRYVKEVIAEWGKDAYVGRGRQRWFGKLPSKYADDQFETEPTGDDNSSE